MQNVKIKAEESQKESALIHPDELQEVVLLVDCLRYTVSDMGNGFFDCYNPREDREDMKCVAWEFNRNRARFGIIENLLYQIEQQLHDCGVRR